MEYEGLHWIDTIIVVASVLFAIGVGIYFAKKQNSTEAYFAASGNIPAWAVGMSMFATIISSVTSWHIQAAHMPETGFCWYRA